MAAYYALILDWYLESSGPRLRQIATAADPEPLRSIETYDPARDFSDVMRADFEIEPGDAVAVRNEYTGNANPAHVCRMTPS